jgi:hypothetical protein
VSPSGSNPRGGALVPEVPQLFSSPYWYEGYFQLPSGTYPLEIPAQNRIVLVGAPSPALHADLAARVYSLVGTVAVSRWIAPTGVVVDLDPADQYSNVWWDATPEETGVEETIAALTPAAAAAREIRELSALSVDQLAALFPDRGSGGPGRMSRENYHRWLSGRTAPTDGNLERLLGLQQLLREVASRVEDVHSWLLTPSSVLDFDSPYSLLRRGAMSRIWIGVSRLPIRHTHPAVVGPEGDRGTRIDESLRGSDARTPAEEMDDATGWFEG